jgi:glycosyltransferase involved in cell wall biosynthesis
VRHAVFVVAGALEARTGGSIYNHRMAIGLRGRGWRVDVRELHGGFPSPSAAALAEAARVLRDLPDRTLTVVDGLAYGAMPDVVLAERTRLPFVPVIHMPLAQEAGLDEHGRRQRGDDERRALTAAAMIVATGSPTVEALASHGVSAERLALVIPGTDPAAVAHGSTGPDVQLLCVAAATPGKGYDVLFRALAGNRQYRWRLTCAGSLTRCPGYSDSMLNLARSLELLDRTTFTGELDAAALNEQFGRTDVFVLATLHETFGMAVAEAVARGIPVVSTTTGEIPRLVAGGAGHLVPPGSVEQLSVALAKVLGDATYRSQLREAALAARERLVTWDEAAVTMSNVLEHAREVFANGPSSSAEYP